MYIFDTSAVIGISNKNFIIANEFYDIGITTTSFYEILCHLDEIDNDKTFQRQKGKLLKCKSFQILYDPWVCHAQTVGIEKLINKTRFEEPKIISQILKKLETAKSLEDFYNSNVVYSNGQSVSCRNIAENARLELEKKEIEYKDLIKNIKIDILAKFPDSQSTDLSSQQLANQLNIYLTIKFNEYKEKDKINDKYLLFKIFDSMYFYIGYMIFRTVKNLQKSKKSGTDFEPELNDFEDGNILLCLNLFKNDVFVTTDSGTVTAVEATAKAFNTFVKNKLNCEIKIESNIISNSDFNEKIKNMELLHQFKLNN